MRELIDKQAAMDAICNACGKIDCDKMDKCEKLQLPPANCSEFPNNSDTISRQAAIDAVSEYATIWMSYTDDMSASDIAQEAINSAKDTMIRILKELPAAQPDHVADSGKKVSISCGQENDVIFRKAAIEAINGMIDRFERLLADIRESKVDDSVCGMCEYDGAYMGQSGDWCNECPGFDKDDCFKLSDRRRKRWMGDIVLPSAQPERKKGEWIKISPANIYECSECGKNVMTGDISEYDFCHGCGADMRGEQE